MRTARGPEQLLSGNPSVRCHRPIAPEKQTANLSCGRPPGVGYISDKPADAGAAAPAGSGFAFWACEDCAGKNRDLCLEVDNQATTRAVVQRREEEQPRRGTMAAARTAAEGWLGLWMGKMGLAQQEEM